MMRYKGTTKTVQEVGDELRVDYVLEGSVRREAGRVRVAAQLIQVADQAHLWAGTHEQPIRSILALQRELASDIGREIRLRLSPEQASRHDRQRSVDPDAYEAHLKGRYFLAGFTPESVRRSVEYFQQAVALEPAYAEAFASLAEACVQLPVWVGVPPAHALPRALEAAQKALALDPDLAEAHASLGLINAYYVWDWAKADRCFQRALELNPSCVPARQWYSEFLAEMGRIDEALASVRRAKAYDPLSRSITASGAFALWLARRFDEAIQLAEQVLEIDPKYPMALIRLGLAYAGKEMHNEAVEAFRSASEAAPSLVDTTALLGYAYARAGRRRDALTQLAKLRREASSRYVPPFLFSNVYLGLGEQDEALHFMEMEFETRGWYMLLIKHSPLYDPLRSHPRFQALTRRMNFPS
jgi:tetratricopeptide (TPR) repeat protein